MGDKSIMMTIPFKELMRYDVKDDGDYYHLMQLYDERNDLYDELDSEATENFDVNELLMIQSEIDEIDGRILTIRKKYSDKLKRLY